jgi:hypothetical protein
MCEGFNASLISEPGHYFFRIAQFLDDNVRSYLFFDIGV